MKQDYSSFIGSCVDRVSGSYIDIADVELLGCVATLEVASGVNIIVSDNPGNYVRC